MNDLNNPLYILNPKPVTKKLDLKRIAELSKTDLTLKELLKMIDPPRSDMHAKWCTLSS